MIQDTLSKNEIFFNKENTLFCDEYHKTYKANKIVANLLRLYIKEFKYNYENRSSFENSLSLSKGETELNHSFCGEGLSPKAS